MSLLLDPTWKQEEKLPSPDDIPNVINPSHPLPRLCKLDEETEKELVLYFVDEIRKARLERQPLLDEWVDFLHQYGGQPETEVRTFPFERASNIVIPLSAIDVEAAHARLMRTVFAVRPFWSIRPRADEWVEVAPAVEEWLQYEVEHNLHIFEFCSTAFMELCKLGTVVGKVGYYRDTRKTLRQLEDGSEEVYYYDRCAGPIVDHVPLANFLIRMHEKDPQTAAWCGEEHKFTWTELKRRVASGEFSSEAIDKIKHYWQQNAVESGTGDEVQRETEEQQKTIPQWNDEFRLTEFWGGYDVDGDGEDEEVTGMVHVDSGTLVCTRYNWYDDIRRPYRRGVYVDVENSFYGIGICKQNEQFQLAVTTINRQRIDNATIANMRMIVAKKMTIEADEPLFPGKIFFVDDKDDVSTIQMGEIYPSSYNIEEMLVRYSEKRTGVNEDILGIRAAGTPATATGDIQRLQEGNKRFDLVLDNTRLFFSGIGVDVLSCFQQFGDQEHHWMIQGAEDGQLVEMVLSLPPLLASKGAAVELRASNAITNKITEQQQWLALFRILQEYYGNVLQTAMTLGSKELFTALAMSAFRASDEALKRLLDTFDIQDARRLTFNAPGGQGGGPQAIGAANGGPTALQGAIGPTGMANLRTTNVGNGGGGGGRLGVQGY